jgi:hypothetical protein
VIHHFQPSIPWLSHTNLFACSTTLLLALYINTASIHIQDVWYLLIAFFDQSRQNKGREHAEVK